MPNEDVESSSYSGFELLLFFVTPIIFTVILLAVLFSLFNFDAKQPILRFADRIPLVNKVMPDPKSKVSDKAAAAVQDKSEAKADQIDQLKSKNAVTAAELKQAQTDLQTKEQQITQLTAQLSQLKAQLANKTQNEAQYEQQIKELANMYAKMMPSKAAPILENLTNSELVLILHEMNEDSRVKILEKMDSQKAAAASIQLKDVNKVNNLEISALQERLDLQSKSGSTASTSGSSAADIASTIAQMPAKSAASLLLEMMSINKNKVISILGAMDNTAKSSVLSSMSDSSPKETAALAAQLMK